LNTERANSLNDRKEPGLRVLIVEDHQDSAVSCAMLLEALGHQARICTNPLDALQLFRVFRPQVVLLDLRMPGLDGFTVARQLREEGQQPRPAIIAITGYDGEEHREKAEQDFDFYYRKPMQPKVLQGLLAAVRLFLAEQTVSEWR